MRILLTAHRFWPHVGGTEEVVAQLAAAYARRGHDVTVATSDEPGSPAEEARDGYRIRRFTLTRRGKFRFPPPEYRAAVLSGAWDVVHLHGQRVWSTDYLYRHLARAKAPVVFTAHGFYQWHVERTPLVDAYYYKRVLPKALAKCAGITALTRSEVGDLASWGVPEERVQVVPGGFDPSEFEKLPSGFRARHDVPTDADLLLYVGGFYPNKRVDRLVRAAADAGATLVVIGKEHSARHGVAECVGLAKRIGADVRVLGTLPRHEVLSAYRESDVFLLGSEFEGYGLVLLEAMAAALPFVATPAGGAPDLAQQGAGVVAPPEDLGREARRLLDDDARRRAVGEHGRGVAQQHAWGRIAERYLAVYEEVAGD